MIYIQISLYRLQSTHIWHCAKTINPLIQFAILAFSYVKKEKDIETFIKNRLKIFDHDKKRKKWNEQYVKQWLMKKLITAPKDTKTIRKNKLRKFLQPTMVDIEKEFIQQLDDK